MHRRYTTLITASVLAMAASSALGQIQSDSSSSRQSLQIAEQLMQERAGLYSAIAIAETHTKGIAIGVRLTRNQNIFSGQGRSGVDGRTTGQTSDRNETNRTETDRSRSTGQPQTPATDRDRETGQPRTPATDRERQPGQPQTPATERERQPGQPQTPATERERQPGQPATDRDGQPGQTPATDRDRQTGQPQTRSGDQWSTQSGSLYAIVTCVVDRTKVREVVIDMQTNTVVGVQSATFSGGSEYADRDGRSGEGRDYSGDYNSSAAAGSFVLASDLMNATARTKDGDQLGDIDELAIDPDSNRVVYGVLRRGGFLGMGESRYAIPTSELTAPHNGRIVLGLDDSHFKNTSGFDNDNWPTQAESKLRVNQTTTATSTTTTKRIVKASDIIGNDVKCRDGHTLGEISDLVVEPRTGRVLYVLVNTDGGYMPIPTATLKKTDKDYTLAMPMTQLRSMPMLDTDRDTNWSDESWNQRIHESHGAKFETASARDGR